MNATIMQGAVLVLGALFAVAGIALFAKRGITGKNTIKIANVEFQLAGSSLVVFVIGCGLIVFAARMQTFSKDNEEAPPPIKFTTYDVVSPQRIERVEYVTESSDFPKETINEFLRLKEVAFGSDGQNHSVVQIRLTLKNTTSNPIFLDLTERFFTLDDASGRAAALLYFCCPSRPGELLSATQEREIQLFFQSGYSSGKEASERWLFFQVQGLRPVVRAMWKIPTLATAE